MKPPALKCLGGITLLGLCACGGSERPAPTPPLNPGTTSKAVAAFLLIESSPSTPAALPSWQALPGEGALNLAPGVATNGCTIAETTLNPDGSTTLKATFTCSSQADGSTLSGAIWFTFSSASPGHYLLDYKDLKLVHDTQSWTVNGTKRIVLDLAAKRAALSTPAPMTMSFLDTANPSASRAFSYDCHLVSDWGTLGAYKLWGTFSLQSGNAPILSGTIPEHQPLAWAPGCCHPNSGILTLSQGSASSDLHFALPCGGYAMAEVFTFAPQSLPACPD